jgi:hypothetical protein
VRLGLLISIIALACAWPGAAFAGPRDETSHGRIDGDLAVSAGAGATVGPRGPRGAADLRLRYLFTAGLFATYEDGPLVASAAEPRRVLTTGVELRPLFLARWLQGHESGTPRVDLLIDSLGLELGAVFVQPEGARFGARRGLQAGLGLDLPLFPRASGLVVGVHGGARWSDAALAGFALRGPSDRAAYLTLVLAWQQVFGGHVVDVGDRSR